MEKIKVKYNSNRKIQALKNGLKYFVEDIKRGAYKDIFEKPIGENGLEAKDYGLLFEQRLANRKDMVGLTYIKNDIEDPKHIADLFYGDFILHYNDYIFYLDIKISTHNDLCGAISLNSIKTFGGWYLCCSRNLSKIYVIDSMFLRRKIENKELKSTCENEESFLYKDYGPFLKEAIKANAAFRLI